MATVDFAQYVMPRPTDIVRWQHAPGAEFHPAIVTQRGRSGISVMVFAPGTRVATPKDGVLHVSDPRVKQLITVVDGLWDFTQEHLDLAALKEAVSELFVQGGKLNDRVYWWESKGAKSLEVEARLSGFEKKIDEGLKAIDKGSRIAEITGMISRLLDEKLQGFYEVKEREFHKSIDERFKSFQQIEERLKRLEEAFLAR